MMSAAFYSGFCGSASHTHGGRRQDANKYMESEGKRGRCNDEEKGEAPAIKWHSRRFFRGKREKRGAKRAAPCIDISPL